MPTAFRQRERAAPTPSLHRRTAPCSRSNCKRPTREFLEISTRQLTPAAGGLRASGPPTAGHRGPPRGRAGGTPPAGGPPGAGRESGGGGRKGGIAGGRVI